MALGANTPALIDAALSALPAMLPKLDYSTLKNTLFPLIANVFTHTNSLSIKIRTLEAFHLLCGGSADRNGVVGDGLDGIMVHNQDKSTKAVLDKYVIQEKLVPMMKSIRTKEPDVMVGFVLAHTNCTRLTCTDGRPQGATPSSTSRRQRVSRLSGPANTMDIQSWAAS